MKRLCYLLVMLLSFTGCSNEDSLKDAMELRQKVIQSAYAFDAEITADYGDTQLSFVLHTQVDKDGNVVFSVLEPQSIAGITGTVSQSGGKLTFDDKAVAFHLLAEGQLSPICGPWIMVKALRGGYLSSCCAEEDLFHLSVDDSYEAESMGVEVWFDENGCIAYAEVYWQGRMLLSMKVENFVYV